MSVPGVDPDGSDAWTSHYRSAAENGDTVAWIGVDGAGNPLLVGTSDYSSVGRSDFAVVRLDGDAGTTLWVADEGVVETHTTFGCAGPYSEQRAVAVDDQGNTFVAGCEFNSTGYDYLTGKLDPDGNWLWRTRYDGGASDRVVALALDSEGNVLVTGGAYGDIQTRTDYYTIKYDGATGSELWNARFTSAPGTGHQTPSAMALDANDDVIVAGMTPTLGMGFSIAVVKYRGTDGEEQWATEYNSVSGEVHDLAVDSAGDVVVAGRAGLWGFSTLKFSGATGALQWLASSDDQLGINGEAFALAIDNSDDIVSTGTYYNVDVDEWDLATIKYKGSDGSVQWFDGHPGPAGGGFRAYGVRIDSSGAVLISGTAERFPDDSDWVVIKYAGSDGEKLWERYFGTPTAWFERAMDLRINAAGDVYVLGGLASECLYDELAIAKYAGPTGDLLWSDRIMPMGGVRHAMQIANDGSLRVAGTAATNRGTTMSALRVDETGVVDGVMQDGFESGVPSLLNCPEG
ncbi:MAG: PQQ-binding-like beta-propeller repeat protein [Xanthomonadales bacterium]|nr:PQQ-binding-like beta-propeller repeat protein [Xanthomonadales bacterium]